MFKTNLRIAIRHLRKNRGYTLINIAGLSIGMAIALIIGLWVVDECTYNHYAPNHSRVARGMINAHLHNAVKKEEFFTGTTVMTPLGKTLETPQYKNLFTHVAITSFGEGDNVLFTAGDKTVSGVALTAQSDLAIIFGFRMLSGSPDAAKDPSTLIIAQSLAKALFGNDDPIGKNVKINNDQQFRIGGVYVDNPRNTTFHNLQAIIPWENKNNSYYRDNTNWGDHNSHLYVELKPGITAEQATARIKALPTSFIKEVYEEALLYPIDKAYLYNEFNYNKPDGGRITMVYLFGTIGAFVLLLACINFMNLSTARSEQRAREVGIRKTIGSLRSQLITQFLSESVLLAVIALFVALLLAELSLPFFNDLAAKSMSIPWASPLFLLSIFGFTLFTGLLAGSYPAFYLSAFRPVKVLKGKLVVGKLAGLPRQILVVLQFTVSLTLIIGTTVVFRQILFTKDRPVGYNREGLVTVDMNTEDINKHYQALRTELIQKGLAANMGTSNMRPTAFYNGNSLDWAGRRADQVTIGFNNVNIDADYGSTIGWKITRGRDMSRDFPTDSNAAILNEKSVESIGVKDPIGMTVKLFGKSYHVIGVSANMVNNSPYDTANNAIFVGGGYTGKMIIRIKPGTDPHKSLAAMEPIFKKFNPGSPFIYNFVDEAYAEKFETELRIGNLAAVFTGLAIFISCLGLFGLAAFVAEQRTKEIGVRKVLGAGIINLCGLLSKEFLKLTTLSILFAVPLAYYGMDKWLQTYLYRAPLSWWIFAAAAGGLILITLLTVSYQSVKAALMNPIKSLRSE
jgi:ABC-type antimicrobial peptide transport system permease subunit